MEKGHNSYSKTDPDATFMRMKEDHIRNGQLKPGYNVQIAVNSKYITGIEAFSDRTDVKTLRPMLNTLSQQHQARYEEIVADAGYKSRYTYLYLDSFGQTCLIKPTNYDQKKRRKFKKQTGRVENMTYTPWAEDWIWDRKQARCRTDRLYPPLGTGVKIAAAVPAAVCAVVPRLWSNRNCCVCKRLFGRSVRKPHSASPPSGASICAYAAPSR